RPARVRAVIADLEHSARASRRIGAEGDEDSHQVLVPTSLEDLAGEREGRILLAARTILLTDEARQHLAQHCAVAVYDGHLGPGRLDWYASRDDVGMVRGGHRADDHRLPRACRVEEHVVRGEEAVFLQRPSRHPRLSSARA